MKQLLTLLFSLTMMLTFGQHSTKSIQSEIDQVTVYLSGAQISRSDNVQLKRGKTEIIFESFLSKLTVHNSEVGEVYTDLLEVVKKESVKSF